MIVDDHPMMREGLAQLLEHEPDLRVCFEADTAAQAFGFIAAHVPDLLLLDISLPDRSGVELTNRFTPSVYYAPAAEAIS